MAQLHAIEHLGAIYVKAGIALTTASILTQFPTATVMIMKTENIKVSINGTAQFLTIFGGESYIQTGKTLIFDKDCTLAIGIYKVV